MDMMQVLSPYSFISKHALLALAYKNRVFLRARSEFQIVERSRVLMETALAQGDHRRNEAWVWKCGDRVKTWKFPSLPNGRQRSGSNYGNSSRKWGRGEWDCGELEFWWEGLTLKAEESELPLCKPGETGQIIMLLYLFFFSHMLVWAPEGKMELCCVHSGPAETRRQCGIPSGKLLSSTWLLWAARWMLGTNLRSSLNHRTISSAPH